MLHHQNTQENFYKLFDRIRQTVCDYHPGIMCSDSNPVKVKKGRSWVRDKTHPQVPQENGVNMVMNPSLNSLEIARYSKETHITSKTIIALQRTRMQML